jgi:hypothetical protein
MKWLALLVPLVGAMLAVGTPLWRYGERQRNERAAIDAVTAVQAAQQQFYSRYAAYATSLASLVTPCDGERSAPAALADLDPEGYRIEVRGAMGAGEKPRDCHGRATATDYYVAVVPTSPSTPSQTAFAARSDGRVFLFYDGIAPREADMSSGLPTPLAERETFTIP